jgi:hypothetical protein
MAGVGIGSRATGIFALPRWLRTHSKRPACSGCRLLTTAKPQRSGHNRWSKIKHDKAGVDAKKNKERSVFSHEIAMASKCGLST